MNFLRDVFEIMGQVTLIVMVGMFATLPTGLVVGLAIEYESWLLGLLAFAVFVLTTSVVVYLAEAKFN